jgi:acetyl esterase/lipase
VSAPVTARLAPAPTVSYGEHPDQVANLHLPNADGPFPVVVLVHGGFWRYGWDRTLMTPLAVDLARRGIAAWNIEYRRVGQEGGAWPGTFHDVAAAVDHLASIPEVDPSRMISCGHSAGGHLALWIAARPRLPEDAPGAQPRVTANAAIALGAVCDVTRAGREVLGKGAAAGLLGGSPDEVPDRYAVADPAALLPLGVPQVVIHGGLEDVVPLEYARDYAARAGDEAELVELPESDHFDVIEPTGEAWAVVLERLPALLGAPRGDSVPVA